MASEERIQKSMSKVDVIYVMGGENIDSLRALTELTVGAVEIDPDKISGALNSILVLDGLGIYDERIGILYKDVCKCNLAKMIAVLHAYRLFQIAGVTKKSLNHAIENGGEGLDLDAIVEAVKKRIPKFDLSGLANQSSECCY